LRALMRRVTHRIAVSESARRTVARHFPGLYDIVPNGIEIDRFSAARQRPRQMAPDRRHILYVGRLEPRKGIEHLIRAMRGISNGARLLIVGEGPDRSRLEALASATAADVSFAGRVADEELPAYFQASDIVCSPAIGGESFGLVLLEAMACGAPVVASRIDGYAGLAGDNDCALLVPP